MAKVLPLSAIARLVSVTALLDDRESGEKLCQLLATDVYSPVSESVLKQLISERPDRLSNSLLAALCPPHLRKLSLKSCSKISLTGIASVLNKCTHLIGLDLGTCDQLMHTAFFTFLSRSVKNLVSLSVENNDNLCSEHVREILSQCHSLKVLNVSCTTICDSAFLLPPLTGPHGCQCELTSLDISGCQWLTAAVFAYITRLCGSKLQHINFSFTKISCLGLIYLSGYRAEEYDLLLQNYSAIEECHRRPVSCTGAVTNNATQATSSSIHSYVTASVTGDEGNTEDENKVLGAESLSLQNKCDNAAEVKAKEIEINSVETDLLNKHCTATETQSVESVNGSEKSSLNYVAMTKMPQIETSDFQEFETVLPDIPAEKFNTSINSRSVSLIYTCPNVEGREISEVCDELRIIENSNITHQQDSKFRYNPVPGQSSNCDEKCTIDGSTLNSVCDNTNLACDSKIHAYISESDCDKNDLLPNNCDTQYKDNICDKEMEQFNSNFDEMLEICETDSSESVLSKPESSRSSSNKVVHYKMDTGLVVRKNSYLDILHESTSIDIENDISKNEAIAKSGLEYKEEDLSAGTIDSKGGLEITSDSAQISDKGTFSKSVKKDWYGSIESGNTSAKGENKDTSTASVLVQDFTPCLNSVEMSCISYHDKHNFDFCLKMLSLTNPQIKRLVMSYKQLTDDVIVYITGNTPRLKHIALVIVYITGNTPRLKHIALSESELLTSHGLANVFHNCPNLTHANLQGVCFISDTALFPLWSLNSVTNLNLAECKITDTTLKMMTKRAAQLEYVDFSWCEDLMADERTEVMETYLQSAASLQGLWLRHLPLSKKCLISLAQKCVKLKVLNLSSVECMTDSLVLAITLRCTQITELNLSWNLELTDVSCSAVLRHLVNIKELIISGIKRLTSKPFLPIIADVAQWRRCQALLRLKLKEKQIMEENGETQYSSDEEFEALYVPHRSTSYAPYLRYLDLEYCDQLNDTHLGEIAAVCRGTLKIRDYYGSEVEPTYISCQKGKVYRAVQFFL